MLYPAKTAAQLNAMVGITLMPGLDDYPRRTESTSVADAQRVYDYAARTGSTPFRSGPFSATTAAVPEARDPTVFGDRQNTWDFSHVLNPFRAPDLAGKKRSPGGLRPVTGAPPWKVLHLP